MDERDIQLLRSFINSSIMDDADEVGEAVQDEPGEPVASEAAQDTPAMSATNSEPRVAAPIICKPPYFNEPATTHHQGWHSETSPIRTMAPQVAFQAMGPHPSYIHVAEQFTFQQKLQNQLVAIGTNPTREDSFRLQGVQWINDVRTALQLLVALLFREFKY